MRKIIIICDNCGSNLSKTVQAFDFFSLKKENVPASKFGTGNVMEELASYASSSKENVFCSLECLKEWLDKNCK